MQQAREFAGKPVALLQRDIALALQVGGVGFVVRVRRLQLLVELQRIRRLLQCLSLEQHKPRFEYREYRLRAA